MKRVFASNYYSLRAQWPKASMIRPVQGGFEAYVFDQQRTTQDSRYTHHNFMDKG